MIFYRFLLIAGFTAVAVALVGGASVLVPPGTILFSVFTFFIGV